MNTSNLIRCAAAALVAAAWLPSQSAPVAPPKGAAAGQAPAPSQSRARVQARLTEVIELLAQEDLSAEERADARKKLEEIAAQLNQQGAPSAATRPRRVSVADGQDPDPVPVAPKAARAPKAPKAPMAGSEAVPVPAEAPDAPRVRRMRPAIVEAEPGEPMVVEVAPEGGAPMTVVRRRAAVEHERAHAEALKHARVAEVSPDGSSPRRGRITEVEAEKVHAEAERAHARAAKVHADAMREHERALLEHARKAHADTKAEDVKALRSVIEGERKTRDQAVRSARGRAVEVRGGGDGDDAEIRQVIEEMRKEMREIRELMQQLREKAQERATGMGGAAGGSRFGQRGATSLGGGMSTGPAAGSFGQRGATSLGGGMSTGPAAGSFGSGMRMRGLGADAGGGASGSSGFGSSQAK